MTKIDIISGFLGAGKTTLIKKLLAEAFSGEKLVLIENEFGTRITSETTPSTPLCFCSMTLLILFPNPS